MSQKKESNNVYKQTFKQFKKNKIYRKKISRRRSKFYYAKTFLQFVDKFNIGDKIFLEEYGFLTIKDVEIKYSNISLNKKQWILDNITIFFEEKEIIEKELFYSFHDSCFAPPKTYEEIRNKLTQVFLSALCWQQDSYKIGFLVATLPQEEVFDENLLFKNSFIKSLNFEYESIQYLPWPLIDRKENCYCNILTI